MNTAVKVVVTLAVLALLGLIGWRVWQRTAEQGPTAARADAAVPVEVAAVEHGPIAMRRTLSGTLEAFAAFDVASKVSGRVRRVHVDIGDEVERGQVVVELDDDEHLQAVALAEAELAVAQAQRVEAQSRLEIAGREFERVRTLSERGVASESRLDVVRADHQIADAAAQVADAQVSRAEASLATARIRLGYTRIRAEWTEGDARRLVADRFVEAGDTVDANAPLLSIVEIDPLIGVIHVTERDYGWVRPGQPATLTTDAFPGRTFDAVVTRIAPVFRAASRQARIELTVHNPDHALKPGMFTRAAIVLATEAEATIVPQAALTRRDGRDGVFVIGDDGRTAHWRPVTIGIRDGERVQVLSDDLRTFRGHVVTLGQQLLSDGAAVTVPDAPEPDAPAAARFDGDADPGLRGRSAVGVPGGLRS